MAYSEQQQGDSHVRSSYAVCDTNSLQGTSIPFSLSTKVFGRFAKFNGFATLQINEIFLHIKWRYVMYVYPYSVSSAMQQDTLAVFSSAR